MDEDGYVGKVRAIFDEVSALPGVTAVRFEEGFYTFTHHPQHETHSIPLRAIRDMNIAGWMTCNGKTFVRFTKTMG